MTFPSRTSSVRRILFSGAAFVFAASFAGAQSQISTTSPNAPAFSASNESSSQAFTNETVSEALSPGGSAPAVGDGGGGAAGQQYGGGGFKHYVGSRFAFEAGGGFNAPQSSSVTFGGQFTVGGGLNFSKHFSTLIEYQFLDAKLPGGLIAEANAQGGHDHIWSFTLDPVLDLFPKAANDVYVTGGGGFYRKVTSFTDPEEEEECYYFCEVYETNVTVAHFSSNQGGFNVGAGFQHRMGGVYGDSKTRLFVEARYLDVLSPAVTGLSPNGSGLITTVAADTKVIPVSVGVRF
jgi:hypothetical protein